MISIWVWGSCAPGLLRFLLLGNKIIFYALNGRTSMKIVPFIEKGGCSSFFIVKIIPGEELGTKS